jgi:hypothetical protein
MLDDGFNIPWITWEIFVLSWEELDGALVAIHGKQWDQNILKQSPNSSTLTCADDGVPDYVCSGSCCTIVSVCKVGTARSPMDEDMHHVRKIL